MVDVAKLAGVSHQTVSRVINNSDRVRPETRERVLAAMRVLNYRPNAVARTLATGRSRTLGVVSFNTTLYGPASTLLAIEQTAYEAGYFVSIISLPAPDATSVIEAVERLRRQGVEGILMIAPQRSAARALARLPTDIPIVSAEAGPEDTLPLASVDQFAGAAAATRHLLDLGHRTVCHIAGPSDWLEAEQRLAGWRSTLHAAGARVTPPIPGDWSPRAGYESGRLLPEGVTAVFVANDQMALGLLRFLVETGRGVPGDISLVGFDDVPEAPYFTPPLTTIRQDFGEMGRRSLHLLLGEIESGTRSARRETVTPELIVRGTTAPPSRPRT